MAETVGPAWIDRVKALPVYAVVALTLSFIWFQGLVDVSYENPALTLLLNTLVVAGVSAWVAALALRGYLASGLPEMLYAGCGLVAMGSSFLLSSLFVGGAQGPSHAVAVQNLGVFCASIFHLAAALQVGQPRVGKPDPTPVKAASTFLGVLALTGFFWAAAQYDLAPAFYIPGKGTTPVRQLVLTVSVAMLTVAAAFLIRNATRRGSLSLRCYGLGLGLIAMGLVDVSIAVPGSILSWTGRLSISLGHLYLLSAFMVAIRTAVKKGLDVRAAAADYCLESANSRDIILHIQLDNGRILEANAAAVAGYGYPREELLSLTIRDLRAPGTLAQTVDQMDEANRQGILFETSHRRKDGSTFPVEVSSQVATIDGTRTLVSVVRDITERKRAEDALRKRELRLRQALQVSRSFAFEWNPITDEVTRSEECGPLLGLNGHEAIHDSGENFCQRVHPDDREHFVAVLRALTPDAPSYITKYRLVRPDGRVATLEETGLGFFDAAGRLNRLTGIAADVTGREKAEKASRESEARFRLLANTAEQLLTTGDPQAHVRDLAGRVMAHLDCHCFFNFLVADEAAARLRLNAWAGISEEEARRIEWLDYGVAVCGCVARDGRRIVAEHIGITPDVRTELVKSYGVKAYACHPLIGVDGRVLGTLSFGTRSRETFSADDLALMKAVTDQVAVAMVRIQNEQALRRSEEALRKANEELGETVRERTLELEDSVAALRNEIVVRKKIQTQLHQLSRVFMDAADPIIIEDLSGMVVEMNREAEAVYGWSREELIGKPVNTLFLPERHYLAAQLRERCGAGQEIRNWESIRKARSGRVIPSLLTAFPLTDESGKVAFVATICKDISERQEMEARLKDAQCHLQALSRKSLEALEADRRSVARELHDSIGGSLAAIKFALEDAAEQAAKIPGSGAASLDTIVSHLADAIKETKRISANLRPLMLDDLGLLATIDWYTRQFRQRYGDIRLVRQFEVEEHEIPEDFKIVVYRVMQEAVTNAARHSRADTICIRLKKSVTHFEFEVEDNGCGFDLNEAFDRKDQLTGFGLRSMQERAEICGGVINIYTQPGEGTCVRITRPVETNPTDCATG